MESVRKHRDIKLITTGKRRNKLASEPNYHTTKYFLENVLAVEIKKTKVKMNKPVILDILYILFILKLKIFMKTLLMMLNYGLSLQIMMMMLIY